MTHEPQSHSPVRFFFITALTLAISTAVASAQSPCAEWAPGLTSFPGVDGVVYASTVFDDGTGPALYVGGIFSSAGGVAARNIAKWNGSGWSSLGGGVGGGYQSIHVMAAFDDGTGPSLYVGGELTDAAGIPVQHLARWNGHQWSDPASFMNGNVESLGVYDDGTGPALFIGGDFTTAGGGIGNHIAKWDGRQWSSLATGVDGPVLGQTVFDDGSGSALYVVGNFALSGSVYSNGVARWNGTAWSRLGAGAASYYPWCAVVFDDGTGPALYVAGPFHMMDGIPMNGFARWNGHEWSSPPNGEGTRLMTVWDDGTGPAIFSSGTGTIRKWDGHQSSTVPGAPGPSTLTVYDDGSGAALFVGGDFTLIGGAFVPFIAKWNGATWSTLGTFAGPNGWTKSIASADDGTGPAVYVGGDFGAVGQVAANHIARWNGTTWSPLGLGIDGFRDATVSAIAAFDDGTGPAVYAGGSFSTAGEMPASNIAKWNGSTWSPLGSGLNDRVLALTSFDDGSGPALYVGGTFRTAGGVPAAYVARWNGSAWSTVGREATGSIVAFTLFDGGSGPSLCALGAFTFGFGVARWTGVNWSPVGAFFMGSGSSLTVFDDGTGPTLYAGNTYGVSRWNGITWANLGSGMDDRILSLATFDDGSGAALYAAGRFRHANGVAANKIARWNGTSWSSLAEGLGGTPQSEVWALATFNDGTGPALCAAGTFVTAGGFASRFCARWEVAPRRGNVSARIGETADVVYVNGSAGDATRTVTVGLSRSIDVELRAAPGGPSPARYVLWSWLGEPQQPVELRVGSSSLGCVVNPTPLQPAQIPQPFRCLRGRLVPRAACSGVIEVPSPAAAPWSLHLPQGVGAPVVVTLQGLIRDKSALHPSGYSVTNGVILRVR
ncbi:MAG: hypothetical protein HY292_18900 [Planctomycetes bacterium]|nr:hypothetical protein [Planctomycetota bacterium]